ncbi:glycoprotein 3-alpha-L-fucosyltransferase A-like isoform X2 [Argopecten irradians]|uniref:glycoprotein 3-alpha-L-fucosyltransferase A-like isoform X2 n=1 Tax=Argopecten irradians TaxID=31199 RepID=UPI00371E2C70
MRQTLQFIRRGVLVIGILCIVMMYFFTTINQHQGNKNQPAFMVKSYSAKVNHMTSNSVKLNNETVKVLYYNRPEWVSGKEFSSCKNRCELISGSKALSSAKFVIFHGPRLTSTVPPKKSRGQVWIMHGMESPVHYFVDLSNWKNVFNWTFTFRRDSDVTCLYSDFQYFQESNKSMSDQWKVKNRTAAWMVSNCRTPSKRDKYVRHLRKSADVHIYGKCGAYKCPKSTESSCLGILKKHYRYYLGFENSLCVDYVTEKGYKTYRFSPSTIPVLRGGLNYSLYFPPGSYLDTKNFESAIALGKTMSANTIDNLDRFFAWTKYFSKKPNLMATDKWCDLCKHIHNAENYKRLYSNIKHWLDDYHRGGCKFPTDL